MRENQRPRVLILSRNYPNSVTPFLGLWVEGLVQHLAKHCDIKVVAPTPYCPPLTGFTGFTKFRSIEKEINISGVDVFHPRFLTGPGYSTYNFESNLYFRSVVYTVDQIRESFSFDIIHANFSYPDGVVAAKLSERYGVPFIITEHASWIPWMDNYPRVRQKALWAAERCAFHLAVSNFTKETIAHFTKDTQRLRVIPNGVDSEVFRSLRPDEQPNLEQILCVGVTRHVKGIDVLLHAMKPIAKIKPKLKLIIIGGGFNRDYLVEETKLRVMSKELGLSRNVEFAGFKPPNEVARYMRESALLVLPSRRETFATVLIEALACGTPVVATDCGGPRDIVNEKVGLLVPVEDSKALASSVLTIIDRHGSYDRHNIREYAIRNFSWDLIAHKIIALYHDAVVSEPF